MPLGPSTLPRFLDPAVLRSLKSIELKARLLVEGLYASRHRSPFYGYSVEFKDYREYSPGDDPRIVDWRMLARTERFYVKRFEMESNMNVVPLLDVSGSMGYQPSATRRLTKFEYGGCLAAALAYLARRQQDAAGLVAFDRVFRVFVPPRQGQRHLFALLAQLEGMVPGGKTDLPAVLDRVALRLTRRSILVLISDCHGDEADTAAAVRRLAARGHELVVMHLLDDDEVSFPFQGLASFRDAETGHQLMGDPLRLRRSYLARLEAFRAAIRQASLSAGADYLPLSTAQPIETVLRDYLLYRRRRA